MKIGIIGFEGSGKTSVFDTLVGSSDVTNALREEQRHKPRIGAVSLKDERLRALSEAVNSKKTTYAEITYIDRPGFDITNAKDADALAVVLGSFLGKDPIKELKDIEVELIVLDLSLIQNRIKRLEKEVKASSTPDARTVELKLLELCEKALEREAPLATLQLDEAERNLLAGFQLLTLKEKLAVMNIGESELGKEPPRGLLDLLSEKRMKLVEFCAKVELEIQELEESERPEFLKSLGIDSPGKDKLVKASCEMLELVSFFTTKNQDSRAWMVKNGTTALDAAGKIHTDIKRGFIRAEVVRYADYVSCDFSHPEAKKRALLRLEGKEYIVKDGDIIDFKFNV